MPDKLVLLALAPWPTLLSLVRSAPHEWIVWGALPDAVRLCFEAIGIEVCNEALPRPFHRAELPNWLHTSHRGVVVPALGHPLPTRWPIIRQIAKTGAPIFIASHGQRMRAPAIPPTDAYTWALDSGEETAAPKSPLSADFACVRADLLGDLLLALPALKALAAAGSIQIIIREEWRDWIYRLLPGCGVQGLQLAPWSPPSYESVDTSVDLSPPGWNSPLTPSIARAVPANTHLRFTSGVNLSEMIASAIGLKVHWPSRKPGSGKYGVLVPAGSSLERTLPEDWWLHAVRRVSQTMGIHAWTILDPDNHIYPMLLRKIPNARTCSGFQKPSTLIELVNSAAVVVGVSTALTHLAALAGTPALVVEHPTTAPEMYRAPVPFVRYIRPAKPWWCDNPSDEDVDRAIAEPDNTYGFVQDEWRETIEQIMTQPPFTSSK